MSTSGRLVVISGPSGAGKTTLCDKMLERPGFERIITCTTRAPRTGEVNGVDYHFLEKEEFERGIQEHRFLEHADVYGHYYGTPRDQVEDGIDGGRTLLLNIDVQGARQLREAGVTPMTSVFIVPPSFDVLAARLKSRGTDSADVARKRLEKAREEMEEKAYYHHVVVNDDLEQAVSEILALLGPPVTFSSQKTENR